MYCDPDVMTRSGEHDDIHGMLRNAVCVPIKRYLWVPADMITFVPGLLTTIYGDGRALWHLSTINQRPAFYVIRGDSGWIESNWSSEPAIHFADVLDRIYEDLEDEFGPARLDYEEDDPALLADGEYPWPAVDLEGGCSWCQESWPKQFDHMTERSKTNGWRFPSILRREYASEDSFARLADDGCPNLTVATAR